MSDPLRDVATFAQKRGRQKLGMSPNSLLALLDERDAAVSARQEAESRLAYAGHRTTDPHDCFLMRCHDLARDSDAAERVRLSEALRLIAAKPEIRKSDCSGVRRLRHIAEAALAPYPARLSG